MRSARLDRLITIQRKSVAQSDSGAIAETWVTLLARRRSSIWTPQTGSESFVDPQLIARERFEWLIRYSRELAGLTPQDRIIYPALSDDSPEDIPDERNIYDIVSVHEYGRREGLRIVTARRPDIT